MLEIPMVYPVAFCKCGGVLFGYGFMPENHSIANVSECPFCNTNLKQKGVNIDGMA